MESQEKVGELTAKVKALEAEIFELKLSSARKSGAEKGQSRIASPMPSTSVNSASSVSATTAPAVDKQTVYTIRRFGRYAQVECSPLFPVTAFGRPKPPFRHDSPDRYADNNIALGFTADLYHCIPPAYHDKILNNSESFRVNVSHQSCIPSV